MTANHIELLVEEPSMEAFLAGLLPRLLPEDRTFLVHPFQGKGSLLGSLGARLRAYARWLPDDFRIVVVVDRDDEDCSVLKSQMEKIAHDAGLHTRSDANWQLVNRIAIEELEAWYFGDWEGVRQVYPRASASIPSRAPYRDSDAIKGGTWEAFERVMRQHGYFKTGLRKIEVARAIGAVVDPARCSSDSFVQFRDAILDAVT
jgi:hypothetical protein